MVKKRLTLVGQTLSEQMGRKGPNLGSVQFILLESDKRGIVMVSHGKESYNIITGNVIKNEKIPSLKASLETVNSLNKEDLSTLFKKQMREGRLSDKGGAGLGLIDIAKKTGSKLTYQFKALNDEVSFFILTSTINRK